MTLKISGKLITPTGSPAANALIRFSAISSTDNAAGEIISGVSSMSFTSADGSYDIDLQFGQYQLATLISTEDFVIHGNVWIDDTTLATDLEDLLTIISADGHITDELLKKFESFVYRAGKSATEAEVAAKTATDEANRSDDEADRAQAAADAAAASGKIYSTIAEGIAATTSGELFLVVSDKESGFSDLYLNDRGTGVYQNKTTVNSVSVESVRSEIDVSILSGNYDLTINDAVALVPTEFKKLNISIRFNTFEVYKFVGPSLSRFSDLKYWIKPSNLLADGKLNLADGSMLYRGFCISNSIHTPNLYHPDNSCLIIPISRQVGDNSKLTITFTKPLINLGIRGSGLLDKNMTGKASHQQYELKNVPFVDGSVYAYINISYNNGTETKGLEQQKEVGDTVIYRKIGTELYSRQELLAGYRNDITDVPNLTNLAVDAHGNRNLTVNEKIFVNSAAVLDGFRLCDVMHDFKITFMSKLAISNVTSEFVNTYLSVLELRTGNQTIKLKVQDRDDVNLYREYQATQKQLNSDGSVVMSCSCNYFTIKFTVNRPILGFWGSTDLASDFAVIDKTVFKRVEIERTRTALTAFEQGSYTLSSNFTYTNPKNAAVTMDYFNGGKVYKLNGTDDTERTQCCLSSHEFNSDIQGEKSLFIQTDVSNTDASYPPVPLKLFKPIGGSADVTLIDNTLLNQTDGQWIHPDIGFTNKGIRGYKYFMANSIYPNSYALKEDAELFVSNDGEEWIRIQSELEVPNGNLPFTFPQSYWKISDNKKYLFMPIPDTGAVMEFSTNTGVADRTITGHLNHDVAVHVDDNGTNIYITYNFSFGTLKLEHKYRVCYFTSDFTDWFYVREDGSKVAYDQQSAQIIFSKTNGVANYIQYEYGGPAGIGSIEASPQVVKVSDSEYYMYSVDDAYDDNGKIKLGIIRYKGTSPYSFDMNSREGCYTSQKPKDRVWHICVRYIDGKFYLMTQGYMLESEDGVNFTQPNNLFFWKGGSFDLYKPTFCANEKGEILIVQSTQCYTAYPNTGNYQNNNAMAQKIQNYCYTAKYKSMSDITYRSNNNVKGGYLDLHLHAVDKYGTLKSVVFAGVTGLTEIKGLFFEDGMDISCLAIPSARFAGEVNFVGIRIF